MSASYILPLTVFYVDNGKHLPVWRTLPHLAYWLLPSAVGLPLVARALACYRARVIDRFTHRRTAHGALDLAPLATAGRY